MKANVHTTNKNKEQAQKQYQAMFNIRTAFLLHNFCILFLFLFFLNSLHKIISLRRNAIFW